MPEFVHLHVHSDYSLLDGACRLTLPSELKKQSNPPQTLSQQAKNLGFHAIALTDHGVMFGTLEFYKACEEDGISPIIGCEIYLARGSRKEKNFGIANSDYHLILLAKTTEGYHNLVKLVSLAALDSTGIKPRIDKEILASYSKGLIATSACMRGEIGQHFIAGDEKMARKSIQDYCEIFGKDDFYIELTDQGLEGQKEFNRFLIREAEKSGLKLVASNDVHYLRREDAEAQDILLCLQTGSPQADEKRIRFGSDEFYLKSAEEMAKLFSECPSALSNTLEVAEKCQLKIEFGQNKFPLFKVEKGISREEYLRNLCYEGLYERYPEIRTDKNKEKQLRERLDYELSILEKTGFTSYLLIVWDFIHYAKQHDIPVGPGRGSAAGSLAAYTLRITDIDPLRYGLLFERFLNPERVSPPDIDVDFCYNRRGEVISYVREKYGHDSVAQIITYGTMGAKVAVRDVARVLGYSYSEGDRLAKMIPNMPPGITLHQALEQSPDLKRAFETEEDTQKIIHLAKQIEGLTRQAGVHAAGVVISDQPISEHVPLGRASNNEIVTQYDMNILTEVGLLKMDFLGLKTLTVIQDTIHLIEQTKGQKIDILKIPLDDPQTFQLLNEGKNVGVFQVESTGMRELCRRFHIESVDDIIALIALYRPGPMELIPDYIKRKKGEVEIRYEHPLLERCCADTFGVMIYQEQVMEAASVLAGYTIGQADLLRRAMGKKDKEKMAKERERFVEGCAKTNKIPQGQAERIFDLLEKFAGYGFNKSHSAAYGLIAYQTAWLKANYALEFMAALMTNDRGDIDKIAFFCAECASLGIPVLPPSINQSDAVFGVEQEGIRYGLAAIKNVSETAVQEIVENRMQNGPFKNLFDLCRRCGGRTLNRKTLESLVKAGAMDEWDNNRARLFAQIEFALASVSGMHRDAERGQSSLFEAQDSFSETPPVSSSDTPHIPDWPAAERLRYEKELLGIYVSGHPLDEYRSLLSQFELTETSMLKELPDRSLIRMGGIINDTDFRYTRDKRPFAKGRLTDLQGNVDLFVSPADCEKLRPYFTNYQVALVAGLLDLSSDRPCLRVLEIVPIEQAVYHFAKSVEIKPSLNQLEQVKQIIEQFQGSCPVHLVFEANDYNEIVLETHDHFFISPKVDFEQALKKILSSNTIRWRVNRNPPLPKTRTLRLAEKRTSSTSY